MIDLVSYATRILVIEGNVEREKAHDICEKNEKILSAAAKKEDDLESWILANLAKL